MTLRAESTGLVIASYGQRGILTDHEGRRHRYLLKGRRLRAVCGDHVAWERAGANGDVLVTDILARHNVLERPDSRGKAEPLAANLTCIAIVAAPLPAPDLFLIDRYLCAAEMQGVAAVVVWNKADLSDTLPADLALYAELGYPIVRTSTITSAGLAELQHLLREGISLLAGQSGVGKSSLINALLPDAAVTVGKLSEANREGRHTTTAAYMHALPGGGQLIDTPGVREFAPVIRDLNKVQTGFREIIRLASECRFSDCQHMREPNCAVKEACATGRIAERRYASYKRLRNSAAALQ